MPIFLRRFYIKKVTKILEEREDAREKQREAIEQRKNNKNPRR
jgi:hypothetical protein